MTEIMETPVIFSDGANDECEGCENIKNEDLFLDYDLNMCDKLEVEEE